MRLVDTNILVYAVSSAPEEASKSLLAQEILVGDDLALSVQVLQEFYVKSTHPRTHGSITHERAMRFIDSISHFPIQDLTLDIFHVGVEISQRFQLSYWDGAILAAARALGCDAVYTEDLNHGQDYGGVQVINPFREDVAVR